MSDAARARRDAGTGHLDLLQRVTEQMTVPRKLEDVLGAITRGLVENADADLARIWLYQPDAACPTCRAGAPGAAPPELASLHLCASAGIFEGVADPHHRVPVGMFLGGRVAITRAQLRLDDLTADPAARLLPWIAEHGLRGYAGFPLLVDDRLVGVLGIFRRRTWSPDACRVLGIFATQAAVAIKTAALVEEVERRSERLTRENEYLQERIRQDHGSGEIVGRSPALLELLARIAKVAPTDATVLLLGETGTGKELLARAVHARSARRERALIQLNCGAIAPGLVESELFGHERGAFTGALQRRPGRFELADGGTLFLDEVGELPLDVQVKLLRVLQEGEYQRVGGGETLRTDARIVAATNRDLEADVAAGRFRADLYYRLSVVPLRVPPLRERLDDLPLLAEHFVERLRRKLERPFRPLSAETLAQLARCAWPGNVRELQNVLERACVLAQGDRVELLDPRGGAPSRAAAGPSGLRTLEEVEREHVARVLGSTGGVIEGPRGAARILGLHPNTLRSRMERLGLRQRRRGPARATGRGKGRPRRA